MKATFIIYLCFFAFFYCAGQNNKTSDHLADITAKVITPEPPTVRPALINHISQIIVIDRSFDSSVIGFYKSTTSFRHYSIVAGTNTADEVAGFLENYLRVEKGINPGATIVIVLKKLWLTNQLQVDTADKNAKNPSGAWLSGTIAKFEFYCASGDGYIPLYRFDTAYTTMNDISSDAKKYLRDILIASVQKLIAIDFKNVPVPVKKMSLDDIDIYTKQQFNIPIINTTAYRKGVYKTFNEFKSNNPSFTSYEIKEDKLTKTIFIKDNDVEYPTRDVWGYCDGNDLYIKSGDNYFELIKKQNTFVSLASKSLSRNRYLKAGNVIMLGPLAGGVGTGNKKVSYNLNFKFYELDLDNGELY